MIRWLPFLIALSGTLVGSGNSNARPTDQRTLPTFEMPDISGEPPAPAGVFSLSSGSFLDTVWYGGTRWAPDSLRWEALRDSVWTFDTGIGSSINTGFNPNKPVGYHQTMEGWFGIDQSFGYYSGEFPGFRRSSTCAITGSFSAWAGVTQSEADSACYVSGQGYGNGFYAFFGKTFNYSGTGNVNFSYRYAVDSEPGFDYTYVYVDTTGGPDPTQLYNSLATYNGVVSGTANFVLQPGVTMRSSPGPVTLWFNTTSDGSYSDQDGYHATICGHTAIDDIILSGGINDFTDFETGLNGWSQFVLTTGVGDFSNLMHRGDLEASVPFCPCAVEDSVLVFFDHTTGMHRLYQDNIVVSPWIDLKRGGDVGRPGRIIAYDLYARLPLADYVFVQIRARWRPRICPYPGSFRDQNVLFYFGEAPFCSPGGTPVMRDFSNVIDSRAEQVQIAIGVHYNSDWGCWIGGCSEVSNTTPYIDNIRLGVYGPPGTPIVTLAPADRFQDSFSTDGTLNPGSTGRFDQAYIKNVSPWTDKARLGDTLVASGNGGNTEVRIVFQVRPGPFTSAPTLLSRAARWTVDPSIPPDAGAFGNTWYSARLDTAEQAGSLSLGKWMTTFHESDPGFMGTDRATDPADASELENEILPDHILTPGSRVDYFIQARYIPPDPRNVGGSNWYLTPDTSGHCFYESEVLPSSMAEDTTWNCVLYVDHHDDRELDQQKIEEQALALALGSGGATPEGTRYDRYDVSAPLISLGRPFGSNAGASITQMFAYRAMAWMTGSAQATNILFKSDANLLKAWLTISSGGNYFWASGDGFAQAITASNDATSIDFLANTLGVTRTCNTIRDAACPMGSVLDSTYCLPLASAATPAFVTTLPANVRGNGCPQIRSLDLLAVNPAVTTARGQLAYIKNAAPTSFASITNEISGSGSKSVVDGFALGNLRSASGDLHNPSFCTDTQAALNRASDVLGWFGSPALCSIQLVTGVGDDDDFEGVPPLRPSLQPARPNPSSGRTTIAFVNAVENGRVTVQIFDVTGRLVRTVMDAPMTAGHHEVIWDGSSERGSPAAAGLYFYRLAAGDYAAAKRLVIIR